ncbi:hypothetical protein HNP92_001781 [Methanococcus maripaludis]|uniref:Uncharacterized protein n=1 Tax=Methanococcus maripaludis TaxID=39152 RepID=A0A7J9S7N4_METMI|nr:hypothetical protein [Methanococcus maripaludis]MBB6402459.1 hypothetical protein [Methanococcus maripaludis]
MDFTLILIYIDILAQDFLLRSILVLIMASFLFIKIRRHYLKLDSLFKKWDKFYPWALIFVAFIEIIPAGYSLKGDVLFLSAILGIILTASKSRWDNYNNLESIKEEWKTVLFRFNGYFENSIELTLTDFDKFEQKGEYAILDALLRYNEIKTKQKLDSLKLCYYCKKSENESDEHSRSKVLQLSESLGIINAKNLEKTETFLNIYYNLKNNLDWKTNSITSETYDTVLEEFIECLELNREHLEIKKEYLEVLSIFESYFGKNILLNKVLPKNPKNNAEIEILDYFLGQNDIGKNVHDAITYYYLYCKTKRSKASRLDSDNFISFSKYLGIHGASFDKLIIKQNIRIFLRIYHCLNVQNSDLTLNNDRSDIFLPCEISNDEYQRLWDNFIIENLYGEHLVQKTSENYELIEKLHNKLRELIKNGKLSRYGISSELLDKIDKNISESGKVSNSFLILVKYVTDSESYINFKNGLTNKLSRISSGSKLSKLDDSSLDELNPSIYLVKCKLQYNAEDILNYIKEKINLPSKIGLSIIPLDFSKGIAEITPENTTGHKDDIDGDLFLKLISHFKDCTQLTEKQSISKLFLELGDKKTTNELLSYIPFDLFCDDILEMEEKYFENQIGNIKKEFKINVLKDWADQDSENISNYLIKNAKYPDYSGINIVELTNRGINTDTDSKKLRIQKLCTEIIEKSREYAEALK